MVSYGLTDKVLVPARCFNCGKAGMAYEPVNNLIANKHVCMDCSLTGYDKQ